VSQTPTAAPPAGPRPPAAPIAEERLVALAALYAFFLMMAYAVLKPLRDEMGVQCGARNLKWLWLGTLVVTLLVLPPYWRLVAKFPRRRFIPWVYRGVAATLVAFYAWFDLGAPTVTLGGVLVAQAALYVWISVFNLLVLSVFWSLMADGFSEAQGRLRFGQIATGVTLGALAGPWIALEFAAALDTFGLLLVSVALLEAATQCARVVVRSVPETAANRGGAPAADARPAAGRSSWLARAIAVARSPYLLAIALFLFCSIVASSFLYAQRTEIFKLAALDSATRTQLFGWSDVATQSLTLLLQGVLAGALLRRFGSGAALALQMAVGIAGFALLASTLGADGAFAAGSAGWLGLPPVALSPALLGVILTGVALKGFEYGLAKPGREALFTVVSRDEKYQAKSLIDTGLYRAFDQVSIWTYDLLRATFSLAACAALALAPLLAGIAFAAWLGREQSRRAAPSPPDPRRAQS
jgi:AAA family ATP:ADP antiporter